MENTQYYIKNPNRYSNTLMFCKEHNVIFDIRCYLCYQKYNSDPKKTYFEGREFSNIYDTNKNPN